MRSAVWTSWLRGLRPAYRSARRYAAWVLRSTATRSPMRDAGNRPHESATALIGTAPVRRPDMACFGDEGRSRSVSAGARRAAASDTRAQPARPSVMDRGYRVGKALQPRTKGSATASLGGASAWPALSRASVGRPEREGAQPRPRGPLLTPMRQRSGRPRSPPQPRDKPQRPRCPISRGENARSTAHGLPPVVGVCLGRACPAPARTHYCFWVHSDQGMIPRSARGPSSSMARYSSR